MGWNLCRTTSPARIGWLVLLFMACGCAGDKPDVSHVQPGYVKKSDLLGSAWYYRRTVVDVPETHAPYLTIGTGDLFILERVRWEIQEAYLLAYRDDVLVPGAEGNDPEGDHGEPVAAYAIASHFDITRDYDPQTGEESNLWGENSEDRVWYERAYMRVDWERNLNPSLSFVFPTDVEDDAYGGAFYVHEDDATNPYRARIEPATGYFDFVVNHVLQPDPDICYEQFAFLFTNCGAGEIKVRHAFMRIDEDERAAYAPLWYPDSVVVTDAAGQEIPDPDTGEVLREKIFERFGYYRLDKLTYDSVRGLSESGRIERVMRFHIWEHDVGPDGSPLAYAERTPKPIVYHLNAAFPLDLVPVAFEVADAWNDVLRHAVAAAQNKPLADVPDMFVLQQNACRVSGVVDYLAAHETVAQKVVAAMGEPSPQESTLTNWCAATSYHSRTREDAFTWAQNGDPRYNMMFWIPNIAQADFVGYGPMLADPESGRIVNANAYVLGWGIEDAATRAVEYIQYINDELSLEEILAGESLPPAFTSSDYAPNAQRTSIDAVQQRALGGVSPEHVASLEARFARLGGDPAALLQPLESSDYFRARLDRVAGSEVERDWLLRPEDVIAGSRGTWQPGDPIDDALLARVSPLQQMGSWRQRMADGQRFLQERTFCPLADFDGALVGLAKELKGLPREQQRARLREEIFRAVMLHEVGHNLGLRHNFEASYDALNYDRQFWQLEETFGEDEAAKRDAKQPEFTYSSIMDYAGRINGDFHGLGAYDRAAIKFAYGTLVETFRVSDTPGGKDLRDWRFAHDYRKLPQHLGSIDAMYDRVDTQFDWTDGVTLDEREDLARREVPYLFCSDEYAGYTPTCRRFDVGANYREIFASSYVKYKNYFMFTNYLRDRLTINWSALDRGYATFRDVVTTYQYMVLYRAHEAQLFGGKLFDTDLGVDMATAVARGLNFMSEVVAMPEPGTYYGCNDENDRVVYYPEEAIAYDPTIDAEVGTGLSGEVCDMLNPHTVALGDAQPLFLDFTGDYVTWTFSYLGTYWDKLSALQELTDPFALFFRTNVVEDWRAFSVSLYQLYNKEILDFFASVIAYDRLALASHFDPVAGEMMPRQLVAEDQPLGAAPAADGGDVPGEEGSIFPGMARNMQRYAILFGTALLTSPLDANLDFSKHTRVALEGAYDDIALFDDPAFAGEVAACTLPLSGFTYRAATVLDGNNIGYDMVETCADDAADYRAALEAQQAAATTEERARADEALAIASSNLAEDEQVLQYMRIVHLIFEFGAEL